MRPRWGFGPTMAGVGFAAYQANGGTHGMPNGAGVPHGAPVPHGYGQGQAQHALNPGGVGLGGGGFAPHGGLAGGAHAGPPGGPGLGGGGYAPNGGAMGGAPAGVQAPAYGGAAFGAVPPNWMNFQGVGLGYQPMGVHGTALE